MRILSGIKPTGIPHIGNYFGLIKPAIELQDRGEAFYFIADYHSMTSLFDPQARRDFTTGVALDFLACGLNPDKAVFFRQSDVPEIMELCWILSCSAAKGLMNRAHAYKAAVADNEARGADQDLGITMGLFSYPLLMSADILMFQATHVPVGRDQIQHIEMARDIASRFNHHYGELLVLPEAVVDQNTSILQGLDGRKMSKSYGNTIPLFDNEKTLKKLINKIQTNLLEPGEPKDPDSSAVFQIWQAFATPSETESMRNEFEQGIAWGEAKKRLFELINDHLSPARARYNELLEHPEAIEATLCEGAARARSYASPLMRKIREAVGIQSMS